MEISLNVAPVSASITTDASDGGLGFIIETLKRDSRGEEEEARFESSQRSKDPEGHINRREIEAVLRALQNHRKELRGQRVVWFSDSVTALAAIRKQGTQKLSRATWELTKEVLDLAEQEKIAILTRHVPGRLNCAADALSRPEEERNGWEGALE